MIEQSHLVEMLKPSVVVEKRGNGDRNLTKQHGKVKKVFMPS